MRTAFANIVAVPLNGEYLQWPECGPVCAQMMPFNDCQTILCSAIDLAASLSLLRANFNSSGLKRDDSLKNHYFNCQQRNDASDLGRFVMQMTPFHSAKL